MDMPVEEQKKYALAVFAASAVLLLVGYFIGNSGGADVDAARAAGASAGAAAGKKQGEKLGYDSGYKKGYKTSYKAAYERAKSGDGQ